MKTFALILIVNVTSWGTTPFSVSSVGGFTSKDSCEDAGKVVQRSITQKAVKFVCVEQ